MAEQEKSKRFSQYEIMPFTEIVHVDKTIDVVPCEPKDAQKWGLYGFNEVTLSVHIADRDTYEKICELYTQLTGYCAPTHPAHYKDLLANKGY